MREDRAPVGGCEGCDLVHGYRGGARFERIAGGGGDVGLCGVEPGAEFLEDGDLVVCLGWLENQEGEGKGERGCEAHVGDRRVLDRGDRSTEGAREDEN